MSYDPKIKYYLIKDYNLLRMFKVLESLREDVESDMRWFIDSHAPEAALHNIETTGNLQLHFTAFSWKFPTMVSIPENTYMDLEISNTGVVAYPDPNTAAGRRIIEEQMYSMSLSTAECSELWSDEIAPLLNWKIQEEPFLLSNKDRKIYILVTDQYKNHNGPEEFRPPIGVVSISASRALELLGNSQ